MFFVYLALFAVVGAGIRFFASQWLGEQSFPWATLMVNITGSFFIGFIYAQQIKNSQWASDPLVLALVVGLLGALTTFSSFSIDTLKLMQSGALGLAVINVLANNGLSLGLCFAGFKLGTN